MKNYSEYYHLREDIRMAIGRAFVFLLEAEDKNTEEAYKKLQKDIDIILQRTCERDE